MEKLVTANTVPVFVDDIKNYKNFEFTRLSYFYLDLSVPEEINIAFNSNTLPLAILNFEGIIISGIGGEKYFSSVQVIEDLFDFVYDKTNFNLSTGYIWLPNEMIKRFIRKKFDTKSVLRINMDLFIEATKCLMKPEQLRSVKLPVTKQLIAFSEAETKAFSDWTDSTVKAVKKSYHQYPKDNLRNRIKSIL